MNLSAQFALALPPSMPWGGTFYDLAAEELSHWNPRNRLETFPCPREDVGEYLLNHYCKKEKRATYRRGISHAAFLARSEGLFTDPVYSGKGFHGLMEYIRDGRVPQGSTVVFLHTGGATALFSEAEIVGDLTDLA